MQWFSLCIESFNIDFMLTEILLIIYLDDAASSKEINHCLVYKETY